MPKLKVGEWFLYDGTTVILVDAKPDGDGDRKIAGDLGDGDFESGFLFQEDGRNLTRLKRKRWLSFRSAERPESGHRFYALYSPSGRKALIVAGCRAFTIEQAKAHWVPGNPQHADCDRRQRLNAWSLAYVAKFEAHLRKVRAK